MGRLDNNKATPQPQPDGAESAVRNVSNPQRQINGEDTEAPEQEDLPNQPTNQTEHSMFEDEPDGWDMAPLDISNPRNKRHPRTEGKGGTP
jgi:hypothetical protein